MPRGFRRPPARCLHGHESGAADPKHCDEKVESGSGGGRGNVSTNGPSAVRRSIVLGRSTAQLQPVGAHFFGDIINFQNVSGDVDNNLDHNSADQHSGRSPVSPVSTVSRVQLKKVLVRSVEDVFTVLRSIS